jgi:hypothetical protein
MYNALIRPVIPNPLTRPAPPIRTLDPPNTGKIPSCAAMRRWVYVHDAIVIVGERYGRLRIGGGEAVEARGGEWRGVARAFAFKRHIEIYILGIEISRGMEGVVCERSWKAAVRDGTTLGV